MNGATVAENEALPKNWMYVCGETRQKGFQNTLRSNAINALGCYQCFSLLLLLLLLAKVKWLKNNNNKPQCSLANCGGPQ